LFTTQLNYGLAFSVVSTLLRVALERLRVVEWEQPANNDFLLVSQFSVTGAPLECRMSNLQCRTD
jgi:hypothetical protein